MSIHVLRVRRGAAILVACAAACSRSAARESTPAIRLTSGTGQAYVEVVGLSDSTLDRLADARYSAPEWSSLLRVSVDDAFRPVVGRYEVTAQALRFTPLFPFDGGRSYQYGSTRREWMEKLRLTWRHSPPRSDCRRPRPFRPPSSRTSIRPATSCRKISCGYIEFSAPMGRRSGIEHRARRGEASKREGPFLPLDYEFWNGDRTRFTVFFDPGRVKKGIPPNKQMGRALKAGRTYTLLVRSEWQDANGLPLKESYRRSFRVGPADTRPLDTSQWRIDAPPAGGQTPLVVSFPEPVDHGLLFRALGVRRDGAIVDGDVTVDADETAGPSRPPTVASGRL